MCPHPNPGNLCMSYHKNFEGGIKLRIMRVEGDAWVIQVDPKWNHKSLSKKEAEGNLTYTEEKAM